MTIMSERLKALRLERGYSQAEVAELIGVKRTAYQHYESGYSRPVRKLKELAQLYNVTTDYILGNATGREPQTQTLLEKIFANEPEILSELQSVSINGNLADNNGTYALTEAGEAMIKLAILSAVKEAKENRLSRIETRLKGSDIRK